MSKWPDQYWVLIWLIGIYCNAISKLFTDFCNLSLPALGVESLKLCCCSSMKSFCCLYWFVEIWLFNCKNLWWDISQTPFPVILRKEKKAAMKPLTFSGSQAFAPGARPHKEQNLLINFRFYFFLLLYIVENNYYTIIMGNLPKMLMK